MKEEAAHDKNPHLCKHLVKLVKSSVFIKFYSLFYLSGLWKTILPNPFAGSQGYVISFGQ